MGGGDAVAQGLEAGDLPERAEQDAGDAGVAEQRFDAGPGLRAGPGGGGLGLLGRRAAVAGPRGVDGVGESDRLVVRAARAAAGAGGLLLLAGGPVGGQQLGPRVRKGPGQWARRASGPAVADVGRPAGLMVARG